MPAAHASSFRTATLCLLAAAAQPFANGRWSVPILAWLAPALLLVAIRTQPRRLGLLLGWLMFALGWGAQWWGIVRLPPAYFALAALASGVCGFLPYVFDRLLAPRLPDLAATLVFPCAQAGGELLLSLYSPSGSWGALAYTQYGDSALMQLAAITGTSGISFLVAWGASVAALVYGRRAQASLAMAAFAGTFGIVLLYGGVRLALPLETAHSLRVAGVSPGAVRNFVCLRPWVNSSAA